MIQQKIIKKCKNQMYLFAARRTRSSSCFGYGEDSIKKKWEISIMSKTKGQFNV